MTTSDKNWLQRTWERWHNRGRARLEQDYDGLSDRTKSLLGLLMDTWREFNEDDGGTRAAAIGYYALLSLFPLTVLLALGLTALMGEEAARAQAVILIYTYLPDVTLANDVVDRVFANRGALSAIALVGVTWGGMQIFRVLERAINRAWGAPRRRNFWRNILFALGMVLTMGIMTGASVAATALFELARPLGLPLINWAPLRHPLIWAVVSAVPPFVVTTLLFALLYRFVPHRIVVDWRDVWPGAIAAAVLWEVAKRSFAFYLAEFARPGFNLLYGSVGALIALLTWLYFTGYVILLGAELCAELSRRRQRRASRKPPVWT